MAYRCSLLLRTLPAVENELEPLPQFFFDLPEPEPNDSAQTKESVR